MKLPLAIAIPFLLAACSPNGWDDVPGTSVRVESLDALVSHDEWYAEVSGAADQWAGLLAPLGCPAPFTMDDAAIGGHVVRLIADAEWSHPGLDGLTYPDIDTQPAGYVEVRSGPGPEWRRALLLHELGHAMGLGHADGHVPSIMTRTVTMTSPTADDVSAAACVIGCGEDCQTKESDYAH